MLQARRIGKELYVGVHSDEEILVNKGPTVMMLDERLVAVEACKWCTKPIPNAPYVTDPKVMDRYGCKYVVHGDDITTDANGEDCYRDVKNLGRFIVVKRTPNISTTDLVGRMLLAQKTHHILSINNKDWDSYQLGKNNNVNKLLDKDSSIRFKNYASAKDGKSLNSLVLINTSEKKLYEYIKPSLEVSNRIKNGVYFIDGGFDLFNPGHIEALRLLREKASNYNYSVIVGLHDDLCVNENKGLNYPIMNLLERSLCVLQCKYVDGIVLGSPYIPDENFINNLNNQLYGGKILKVFHGPTSELNKDNLNPYHNIRHLYSNLGPHKYDNISTEVIVSRVLHNREAYEERQRKKGWKSEIERKLQMEESN
ncbi:hypothetical protein PACTADRAFT_36416 [Pachysolen tannophilus NRRL Y-2460]|uniref:ethanolamine-phosphate cytidylyltransferase n=1 Tax=Pachysolen tannophilus NRRL Y-2460 TaxID=669874 RepID=A0A1E4U261_PACTA|nr:hypothetical protein PACTADRAFT_36416 [Pachysolen tannophilus NRRL Y-2460]